jgi:phosphoribosylformylglycinamidine synthase
MGKMKVSVIVFPGSNCDHDIVYTYTKIGAEVKTVWHRETNLGTPDLVVVPGGFSYGDYLRTGALAKLSPVMQEIKKYADKGGNVLGICNGFQILCEAQLLPGVLLQNVGMRFLSRFINMRVENAKTFFTNKIEKNTILSCPIAHFEGNYFADSDTIKKLEDNGQVVFRYCSKDGEVEPANLETNPNGAINAIAGICNLNGNVVGLMPHPERVIDAILNNQQNNNIELF